MWRWGTLVKLRIRSGRAKAGFIVASLILTLLTGTALSFAVSREAAQIAALVLGVALLFVGVGAVPAPSGDGAAARAGGGGTARPGAGCQLAICLALQGVGYFVRPFGALAVQVLYIGVTMVVVLSYLHSSIRLTLMPVEEFYSESQEP